MRTRIWIRGSVIALTFFSFGMAPGVLLADERIEKDFRPEGGSAEEMLKLTRYPFDDECTDRSGRVIRIGEPGFDSCKGVKSGNRKASPPQKRGSARLDNSARHP